MPRANRTLKGNKRRAVFDRLIVPKNGYKLPPQIREIEPEWPDQPVGQRVKIINVIIYEISISYEGKPQKFVKTIPFKNIVGSPITAEQIERGYTFETPQGETLLVKWHLSSNRGNQGLIVHNLKATGTSWYEPNWGQIYGVGLEWISCDGSMSGTMWANRHIGNTYSTGSYETGDFTFNVNLFSGNAAPDYSPHAIRPGLMLGDPEPKTLWLMGQELPMRVYPALGQIGRGCIFGFNRNVMEWVYVKPPTPPYILESGIATVPRGDYISVSWRKDDFTEEVYVGVRFIRGAEYVKQFYPNGVSVNPVNGVIYRFSPNSSSMTGSASSSNGEWVTGQTYTVELEWLLLEVGTDRVIACQKTTVNFGTNGTGNPIRTECEVSPPLDECGNPVDAAPPTNKEPEPEIPSIGIEYFCDGSLPTASVDTSYWVGDRALQPHVASFIQSQYGITIDITFWQGRNKWLELLQKLDPTVPYTNSKISPLPFHTYLFKMLKDLKEGNGVVIDSQDWNSFKIWCNNNGLGCLTDLQKASLYCSYKLMVPVNIFPSASNYLNGTILDVITDYLAMLPRDIYDWIDFNEVIPDAGSSITGAFASDIVSADFKALRSFVNFEPQALNYGIGAAKAHRPVDYIKLSGQQWGSVTAVDYSQYYLPDMNATNYMPYVAAEVGIHEIGHAVSYYGLDFYGQVLHERPDWLAISGWSADAPSKSPNDVSAHLVKSRPANTTGGMPKTDTDHEAPVSDYGCFHPAEDFAEAYRMYIVNPLFFEQKFPQKYNFMVNVVEPMFVEVGG